MPAALLFSNEFLTIKDLFFDISPRQFGREPVAHGLVNVVNDLAQALG